MYESLYGLDWQFVLSCVMLLALSIIWFMYISSLVYGKIHLHRQIPNDPEKSLCLPGVSIAKPLCSSADPNLKENLTSFFELRYPTYEVLFCIQDPNSESLIELVHGLMSKYPSVDAQVFVGAQNTVVNPKVNNLLNAYDNAKYQLFMISDSNITMKPDALHDMVHHMTEKVGIVHQVPLMCDGTLSFSRQVEQVWFGGAHARVYMFSNAFGINCMTGMSFIFRKKVLEDVGGLKTFGDFLAEDYFLTQLVINKLEGSALLTTSFTESRAKLYQFIPHQDEKELKDKLSFLPSISTKTALMTHLLMTHLLALLVLTIRWIYLRNRTLPILILLEPIQEHMVLAPLTSLAVYYMFGVAPYIFLPCHLASWVLADYLLLTVMQNKKPAFSMLSYAKAWVYRELSPLYLLPQVFRMKNVSWGNKTFGVAIGGRASLLSNGRISTL